MTLIVEDGTGLANAESYVSVADADTYHSNLGNTTWASFQQADKEIFLRIATRFMTQRYRGRWKGFRSTTVQLLDWPRIGVFIDDVAAYPTARYIGQYTYMVPPGTVPPQVKDACCELALYASQGPLTPNLNQQKSSIKVGPITINYDRASPQLQRFPQIALILAPMLEQVGMAQRLER